MTVRVECYSGYKADQQPQRFWLGDLEHMIDEVLDQWYGPEDTYFKVRTGDGNMYVLRRRSPTPEGEWSLESFRDFTRGR